MQLQPLVVIAALSLCALILHLDVRQVVAVILMKQRASDRACAQYSSQLCLGDDA